ncbi:MAG: hypothetical protein AB7O04_13210 [Hyphomonadaceae bacterium]
MDDLQNVSQAGQNALTWPALDPDERYRRCAWEGLLIIQRTDEYVFDKLGYEQWLAYSDATRPAWAGPIGRKLVKDHPETFTPTIEGAVKLMAVYGAEVWGSGVRDYTRIEKATEEEGRLTIIDHGCPQWRATREEMRGRFPCHLACGREVDSVVKALGTNFEVETIEGRPLGHDECVWRVRRTDGASPTS